MQLLPDGTRRYAPKDLVAYLAGDFAAWCERLQAEAAPVPAEIRSRVAEFRPDNDPEQELAARKGTEHEQRYLDVLREETPGLIEIQHEDPDAAAKTLAAMRAGAPIIYQGRLDAGSWHGYPDFLYRAGDPAAGDPHYVPWDTKLARSVKPYFLIQLCAYARLLEAVLGRRPDELVLVLGDGTKKPFRTGDFFHYYRRLERGFLRFQDEWRPDAPPDPGLDRSWGQWSGAATALLEARDDPSQVAHITRAQVRRLEEGGIRTLHKLARLDGQAVPGMSPRALEQLTTQARLQVESAAAPSPAWQVRPPTADEPRRGLAQLPPPSPGDVFFDMEGFPFADTGLEYLFGAFTVEPDSHFHDRWAHDAAEEKRAFEGFIDWVHARWRADRAMHVYHYASYEKSAMRNLMVKYATREREVDDLLRGEVLVDLYAVVRQGLFVGTPSYSLKKIERLYRPPREGAVTDASGSTIEYQRWLDEGEPRDWRRSPILSGIRDYNRDDCESTLELCRWLQARQAEAGIAYLPVRDVPAEPTDPAVTTPAEALAARLLGRVESGAEPDPERRRVTQLLAWLVEFHRREEKPMWWRMFDRHARTEDELARDLDCLTGLTRTGAAPRPIKKSCALQYQFDPDQDTKLNLESKCYVAGDLTLRTEIVAMDQDAGLLELKVGPGKTLPDRLSLIPDEFVKADVIKQALLRCAEAWEAGNVLSPAVADLLFRRPPRVRGHAGGPLAPAGAEQLAGVIDVARRLDGTTLAIQGPPGTGKTYTAAAVIADLLDQGNRIGIAANSHKVVLNLLKAVVEARQRGTHKPARLYKVGEGADDPLVVNGAVERLPESGDAAGALGDGPVVIGGTAWVFSRPELQGRLDYLFIDEAGQVSLANAVAMGLSTRNLVLIGDQMQLGQPSQVVHPGESGLSCLEYVLQGHATVPEHLGIFLGVSRRLNPAICRFISDAIYESRLTNLPETDRHRVFRSAGTTLVPAEAGVVFVPVEHDGCDQASNEEVETIARIVAELLGRTVTDRHGGPRPMTLHDILFVAPYNMQVRRLKHRFGPAARVGSVDKFQGQEAPVVIVSMCASSLDESPRGADFLLNPNRLNVAVSRAEALAIVVASPGLLDTRCRSVREMRLVNLLCRLEQYAGEEQ